MFEKVNPGHPDKMADRLNQGGNQGGGTTGGELEG